jgi:ribosomal protein S18 acetylase RimI-like enzyme
MTPVVVRRAGEEDLPAVAVLFDAYRQFYERPADLQGARAYLQARLERAESVVFVAEDATGALVGFCQLYPTFCSVFMARIYVLYDLFVIPGARKAGAGRALLGAAERFAAEMGARRLELRTARTNLPAQALYESSGWQRDELFLGYSKKAQ